MTARAERTLDPERLLDNAAMCSQVPDMLTDDIYGNDRPLRECIRLNVVKPFQAQHDRDRETIRELSAALRLVRPIIGAACSDPSIADTSRAARKQAYQRVADALARLDKGE